MDLAHVSLNLPEEVLHHMFMKKGPVPTIVTTDKQLKKKDRASQFNCLLNQMALIYCMYMYTVDS